MNRARFILLLGASSLISHAQLLTSENKAAFKKSLISTCYSTQRDSKINFALSNVDIKFYCSCIATKISDEMTLQALNQFLYDIKNYGVDDATRFFNENVRMDRKSKQCIAEWLDINK